MIATITTADDVATEEWRAERKLQYPNTMVFSSGFKIAVHEVYDNVQLLGILGGLTATVIEATETFAYPSYVEELMFAVHLVTQLGYNWTFERFWQLVEAWLKNMMDIELPPQEEYW